MKMMKKLVMAILCLSASGTLFAAAGRALAQIEDELASLRLLADESVGEEREMIQAQIASLELEAAQIQSQAGKREAPVAGAGGAIDVSEFDDIRHLFRAPTRDQFDLVSQAFWGYFQPDNQGNPGQVLLNSIRAGSGAQFTHFRSFRQALDLCGFAAVANLYAMNQLIDRDQPLSYQSILVGALEALRKISGTAWFQTLAAAGAYAEAAQDMLNQVAQDIGFNKFIFYITISNDPNKAADFGATKQTYEGGRMLRFEETGKETVDLLRPQQWLFTLQGFPEFRNGVALISRTEDAPAEPEIFKYVIQSLQSIGTTNFILNLDRAHYVAICVNHAVDGQYSIYFLNSTNIPIEVTDPTKIRGFVPSARGIVPNYDMNIILFVDHLIQLAQRSPAVAPALAARPASPVIRPASLIAPPPSMGRPGSAVVVPVASFAPAPEPVRGLASLSTAGLEAVLREKEDRLVRLQDAVLRGRTPESTKKVQRGHIATLRAEVEDLRSQLGMAEAGAGASGSAGSVSPRALSPALELVPEPEAVMSVDDLQRAIADIDSILQTSMSANLSEDQIIALVEKKSVLEEQLKRALHIYTAEQEVDDLIAAIGGDVYAAASNYIAMNIVYLTSVRALDNAQYISSWDNPKLAAKRSEAKNKIAMRIALIRLVEEVRREKRG